MPILDRYKDYPINRDIIWLSGDEQGGSAQIRPSCIDDMFAQDGIAAVSCELIVKDNRLHHLLDVKLWGLTDTGIVRQREMSVAEPQVCRLISGLASDCTISTPLGLYDLDSGPDYYRIYYMANATIITWDGLEVGLLDIEGTNPDDSDYGPSLSDMLGDAYAITPTSNHDRMHRQDLIKRDLSLHTQIVSNQTGFLFSSV